MALLNSNPMWSHEEKLKFIEEITANADAVQERVLAEILKQNAETEYLQRHKLDGATDRATFKAKVPVIAYEDIQPDIERIANGDWSPILSAKPVTEFLTSSGTSAGRRKLIPTIGDDIIRTVSAGSLITAILNRDVPGLNTGKRLEIMTLRSETKTPGGLVARPASTSVYKTFLNRFLMGNTCPPAAALCEDYFQSMYVQMLCGLCQRSHVVQIAAIFASALIRSFQFLHEHWPQLVHDIESGILTDKITEKSLRESVSDILKADPELASFVAEQCSSADWSGIITKLWPNVKCLRTVVTGAMSQYRPMLESYGGGGLPIVSMMYSCSESPLGINLHPMCDPSEVSYTLLPHVAYFEFIPHEPEKKKGAIELADLTKVEVGKKYELVITTYAGLYRYQVGDILQVTGFHNAAPQFKFVCREGVLLSIEMDKTDEVDLHRAVDSASDLLKPHGATLAEYTSYADTKSAPGHYVIYWELMKSLPSDDVLESCCLAMEEALNQVYRERRGTGEIGPLEIRVVRSGAFGKLMNLAVSRGAAVDQYKVPRCIKVREIVELLDSEMVSAHFSAACPKASPNSGA